MSIEYSDLSLSLTKLINKTDKKNEGIYFTPPSIVNKTLQILEPYIEGVLTILEPSCGSCEYITALQQRYPQSEIVGFETNKTIFQSIKPIELSNLNTHLYNQDYLLYPSHSLYDLIIGNPPYVVVKKQSVDKEYYEYFDGRPNIFILFLIKSLKLLTQNGILSFILPKSFLNCLYYDKTRKYITKYFTILTIVEYDDDYIETKQATILFIVQKNSFDIDTNIESNTKYILEVNNYTIFGREESICELKGLYENSTSLTNLHFSVSVGSVVWNQQKSILTDDNTKTLLIYSSDISDNKLKLKSFSNDSKKHYINKDGFIEPILVLNRGYGVGNYNFEYCLIEGGFQYLIENHLICIKYTNRGCRYLSISELISLYTQISLSFDNEKTRRFIELYFGNNAINTTEIAHILPIYV
jgi:adenine-specific DNA-methyltransferase